jgi:hypothetical protein
MDRDVVTGWGVRKGRTTKEARMVLVKEGRGRQITVMDPSLVKFHRYLLVMAHARSYSTLLCHILGSHPQICGYSEAMIPYETPVDLIRLNIAVSGAGNYRGDSEYVLDKILYDTFVVSDVVLSNPRVTLLFMIREPAAAIASHVRMRIREQEQGTSDWGPMGTDRVWNTDVATIYYIQRLRSLQVLCARLEAIGRCGFFLTAEGLIADTAATFRWIERGLELSEPLRENYRVFQNTGARGYGDTSPVIRSGRVVRDRDDRDEEPIPIAPELLDPARGVYEACRETFRRSPVMSRVRE